MKVGEVPTNLWNRLTKYSLDWPSDHLSLAFSCCKRPQYDPPERFSMLIDLS